MKRMHRTLKAEALRPPRHTRRAQQAAFGSSTTKNGRTSTCGARRTLGRTARCRGA
jgi:hypothetical protein